MHRPLRQALAFAALALTAAAGLVGCSNDKSADTAPPTAKAVAPAAVSAETNRSQVPSDGFATAVGGDPQQETAAETIAAAAARSDGGAAGKASTGSVGGTDTIPAVPRALINRKIIRNADVSLEVANVPAAIAKLRNLVATLGGYLATEEATYGSTDQVNLSFRVPVEQFDRALNRLGGIGSVLATNITSQEVTGQVRDIELRLRSKKASVERLRQMLTQAARPADLLEIENQISNREAEIESMEGQLVVLTDQSELSTIRVHIAGKGKGRVVEIRKKQDPSFARAWSRSMRAIGRLARSFAAATGAVLPFLPFVVLIAGLALVRRRRRTTQVATRAATPVAGPSDTVDSPAPD